MKEQQNRTRYRKPTITTEKVFEQAALACTHVHFTNPPINFAMKHASAVCGFTSS